MLKKLNCTRMIMPTFVDYGWQTDERGYAHSLVALPAVVHHHILIPLDGSKFSETILPHAVAFAHATESALMLFQVLEPLYEPIYGTLGNSEKQQEEQMARMRDAQLASIHDYLMNIARPLQSQGLEIHTRVIEGNDPAAQIVLQAEQDPCPLLIAMTTHGRSGVPRWLFGSVTAEVVQAAPTPLLLLRPHENSGPYSTVNAKAVLYQIVIVPLDGSSFAEQAHMLASAVNATLLLVSIVPPPNAIAIQRDKEAISLMRTLLQTEMEKRTRYLEQRAEPLRKQGAVVQTHVATGHPADKILRLSTQHQHSLLVMTTHGRSGLQHLFLGSVAMKVTQGAHVPIILVRGRPE